jgi:hypothetical protein
MKKPLNPYCNQQNTNTKYDTGKLNPYFMAQRRGLNQAFNYNGENNTDSFSNDNEVALLNSLITERIQQHGIKIIYIPRNPKNIDLILGEQPNARFEHSFEIEMIMTNPAIGVNHQDSIHQWGFGMLDTIVFNASFNRVKEEFAKLSCEQKWANPGDILYMPLANKLFSLLHIYYDENFFLLGKNSLVSFTCQLFDKESEVFDVDSEVVNTLNDFDEKYIDPFTNQNQIEKEFNEVTQPSEPGYWSLMDSKYTIKKKSPE